MSIRKNTVINIIGAVVPMVVMLGTVPIYLRLLGEARYGVLALVWLVLGYFSFIEMGLGKATSNQLAKAGNATPRERSEIFWTALTINVGMGLGGAAILWCVGDFLLKHVLEMPENFSEEVQSAFPWLVATFPLALVSSVLNGALEGRSRFLTLNVLQVTSNAIFQLVPLLFAWLLSPTLAVVIPAAVLSRAVMNLFYLCACQRAVPLSLPNPKRSRARTLFTYGGWVAVTGVTVPLLDTVERFIIGVVGGAAAVTHYSVPMQLAGKLKVLPGALSRAMFPSFSSGTGSDGLWLARRAMNVLSPMMTLLVLVTLLSLRPFLELWIGAEIAAVASPIGEILLIGIWFNSIGHIPYFLLQAQGRPDLVAKVQLIELPAYVALAWFAMGSIGLIGVAMVWVLRCAVEAAVLSALSGLLSRAIWPLALQALIVMLAVYCLRSASEFDLMARLVAAFPLLAFGSLKLRAIFRADSRTSITRRARESQTEPATRGHLKFWRVR